MLATQEYSIQSTSAWLTREVGAEGMARAANLATQVGRCSPARRSHPQSRPTLPPTQRYGGVSTDARVCWAPPTCPAPRVCGSCEGMGSGRVDPSPSSSLPPQSLAATRAIIPCPSPLRRSWRPPSGALLT